MRIILTEKELKNITALEILHTLGLFRASRNITIERKGEDIQIKVE